MSVWWTHISCSPYGDRRPPSSLRTTKVAWFRPEVPPGGRAASFFVRKTAKFLRHAADHARFVAHDGRSGSRNVLARGFAGTLRARASVAKPAGVGATTAPRRPAGFLRSPSCRLRKPRVPRCSSPYRSPSRSPPPRPPHRSPGTPRPAPSPGFSSGYSPAVSGSCSRSRGPASIPAGSPHRVGGEVREPASIQAGSTAAPRSSCLESKVTRARVSIRMVKTAARRSTRRDCLSRERRSCENAGIARSTGEEMSDHLEQETIAAFREGRMTSREALPVLRHLMGCAACREAARPAFAAILGGVGRPALPLDRYDFPLRRAEVRADEFGAEHAWERAQVERE